MRRSIQPAAAKGASPIYQLKVVLLGSKPSIWRRVLVPGHGNLGWLHAVLQVALGWTNSHLHQFLTPDARYANPMGDNGPGFGETPDRDEGQATLAQIAPAARFQFGYEYDFGDSWEHAVTVEKILPPDAKLAKLAVCVGGERACPPEDCGGIWGYAELLKTLKNPKHPDHETMREWVGGAFDANAFDLAKTNVWLRRLKWPRVTEAQLRTVLMGRDGCRE